MERPQKLLADATNNTKLRKSQTQDYRIVSLSLSPADEAGTGKSNCPAATAGCIACCVGSPRTGMAQVFNTIMRARIEKTLGISIRALYRMLVFLLRYLPHQVQIFLR